MDLSIFTDMSTGNPFFDTALSIFVCLFTLAVVAVVAIYLVKHIPILKRLKRELKATKRVAALPDALNVEGEVVEIQEKKQTQWDIQYTATVVYYVGQITYYSEYTFLNRGSLRVGTKIGVLCDGSDPASSVPADGSQITALKKLISLETFRIIFMPVLCFGLYMKLLDNLAGRYDPY